MITFNKLLEKMDEHGINSYLIRKYNLIPQSTLQKIRVCSGTDEEIAEKLQKYKDNHKGEDFKTEISSKTIEDLCQLLQCQPKDLIDWNVKLKSELSYESKKAKLESHGN